MKFKAGDRPELEGRRQQRREGGLGFCFASPLKWSWTDPKHSKFSPFEGPRRLPSPEHLGLTWSETLCCPSPTSANRFSQNSRRESSTDCPSVLRHAGNLGNHFIQGITCWSSGREALLLNQAFGDFFLSYKTVLLLGCDSRLGGKIRRRREGFESQLRRSKPKKGWVFFFPDLRNEHISTAKPPGNTTISALQALNADPGAQALAGAHHTFGEISLPLNFSPEKWGGWAVWHFKRLPVL